MYGDFKFQHENYMIRYEAGTLKIDEFSPGDMTVDGFITSLHISMNDLRDIYQKAKEISNALDVAKGDRVVLTDEFLAKGGEHLPTATTTPLVW